MRLKIISDGSRLTTKVVTDSGEELEGVTEIEWHYKRDKGEVYAVITIGDVPCELTGGPAPSEHDLHSHIL